MTETTQGKKTVNMKQKNLGLETNIIEGVMTKKQINPLNGPSQDQTVHQDCNEPENGSDIIKASDIIGDFGPYQIAVVIFAALRAMSCAMDGLSGPFVTPNIKNFQCDICHQSSALNGYNLTANSDASGGVCSIYLGPMHTKYEIDPSQCYFNNMESLRPDKVVCNKWSFEGPENAKLMNSLTIEQSLICDREWLKSLSNSMYYVGATFGLLFWGYISDRFGRKTAYVCSHFVTLIFGFSALFANSMCSYILLRAINAFGMIGELIPRSIQVEIVATEYRFICSVICQIGWALGIILVPALAYLNPGYRFILAFPVIGSALMLPWLYWLPESARWLITNNRFQEARLELRRAASINGKITDDIDSKIEKYKRQIMHENDGMVADDGYEVTTERSYKRMGVGKSILAIFTNFNLLKDTLSVFTLLFVAEVVYFSLTLNVADLGGSLNVNYIISGASELVSIAFCGILLAYLSRRMCLSLLLLASTVSYLLMALVNIYEETLSMTMILSVNAFGKLTAIGNLMVIILVSQEVFPTVIRQFGTSLCITVGKAGSAVAPFTHELGQIIGQSYCFSMFSLICLSCAIIPFGLSETGNRELPDTVVDLEQNRRSKRKKGKSWTYHSNHHNNHGKANNNGNHQGGDNAGNTGGGVTTLVGFTDANKRSLKKSMSNNYDVSQATIANNNNHLLQSKYHSIGPANGRVVRNRPDVNDPSLNQTDYEPDCKNMLDENGNELEIGAIRSQDDATIFATEHVVEHEPSIISPNSNGVRRNSTISQHVEPRTESNSATQHAIIKPS